MTTPIPSPGRPDAPTNKVISESYAAWRRENRGQELTPWTAWAAAVIAHSDPWVAYARSLEAEVERLRNLVHALAYPESFANEERSDKE